MSDFSPPGPPVFEGRQPSSLEDTLAMTTIQLIASTQAITPGLAEHQQLTHQAARLIPLYGYGEFHINSDPSITHHLEKLRDLGSQVLHVIDGITTLIQTYCAQSGVLRILTRRTYSVCLNGYKEQLDIAVETFKIRSVYEARHRVLELVIERFRAFITGIRNAIMRQLEHSPKVRRVKGGPAWFGATIAAFNGLNGRGPPGIAFQPNISNPYFRSPYNSHSYAPVLTQPNSPLDSFGAPGVHLTINMIGSGNRTTSTLSNVCNDNSEVYNGNR